MVAAIKKRNRRISKLREKVHHRPELCIERACLFTKSYKETEGMPPAIRRAKALEKVLKEMTIRIAEEELIVGVATSKQVAGPMLPEVQWQWYLEELDTISTREAEKLQPLTDQEKSEIKEVFNYWKGKSLYDMCCSVIPQDLEKYDGKICLPGGATAGFHVAHCCPGYEKVLSIGLNGIKRQIDEELLDLNITEIENWNKYTFLNAINIALTAVINFANRYSELAKILAKNEKDIQRKSDLERIADICNWVPANPARSFYEAFQSIWFTYLAVMLEGYGPGIGFGRLDQYLYPFFKKDIDAGKIAREEARELIALFYIKLNELIMPFSTAPTNTPGTGQLPLSGITLGGVTKAGTDAVNELSYLFLQAEEDIQLQEDISVRIHKKTPELFLMKVCEIAKLVRGKIKFVGDETIIQQLLNDGKPIENARNYAITGCFIRTVPGRSTDTPNGGFLNLPMMLELALNNGISRLTGEQMGPQTGDPRSFESYEELWDAYKKQVAELIRSRAIRGNISRQLLTDYLPSPLQSALFDGCIESGRDVANNGTSPFGTVAMWICGIPSVGDSLAAIKKNVFETKQISMENLIDALDKNFEGEDRILHLLMSAPKFGNDNDYVDTIVNDVLVNVKNETSRYRTFSGEKYTFAAGAVTSYIVLGKAVGALPDGRRAGEPLSEGGISPYQGRNMSGPTSTMRSVAKLDLVKASGGAVLNMRFNPDGLKDENQMKKFASLIRAFFESGGDLVQFNIISTDTLKEAQRHPKKHKDLLVRVATYSAYFVDLPAEIQDDIIARTEFQEF